MRSMPTDDELHVGDRRFVGRRVLISGAGRGVGEAIAVRLAAEGASVGILDRSGDSALAVARRLGAGGVRAVGVQADVGDHESTRAAVDEVRERLGGIDVLVNNAGRWDLRPFLESSPDDWALDTAVNYYGVLHLTHLTLAAMVEQRYGRIVNIISESARVGEPNMTTYAAAKAAVAGFTRCLAKEVGRHGVTVNCVSLGTTHTPGTQETFTTEQFEQMARRYPLRRLGEPDDGAGAVAFLASDDAGWITGQTLGVSGGYAILP